jgi:Acyl-protein synthetase, LuxE
MFNAQLFKAHLRKGSIENFSELALELFHYQAQNNAVYHQYLSHLGTRAKNIQKLEEIPFLPIDFFKNHSIIVNNLQVQKEFASSATTGQITSKHLVADVDFYHQISQVIFQTQYNDLTQFHILGLLPSYLERNNSSLVEMVQYFITQSKSPYSGFYLHNFEELAQKLTFLQTDATRKTLLIGVTFALLDFAEQFPMDLSQVVVMETGGMKGRRQELIRAEVQDYLKQQLKLTKVHSEYGMTELLSQAYSQGDEIFTMPPTLKIILRDINDPFDLNPQRKVGAINVIDLANVDSCAFIATQDVGEMVSQNQFKVLGRLDNSDMRGCSLMAI